MRYTDDTLLLAGGNSWGEAIDMAEQALVCVVRAIKNLGLRIALHKTEAVFFHEDSAGTPPRAQIMVDTTRVPVGAQIKYLGLQLDGRWSFGAHFSRLVPKVCGVAGD